MDEQAPEIAKASYARCCEADEFFATFYGRFFVACPPARVLFGNTDFKRQHKLLRHAIGSLLIFDNHGDEEPNLLTRIAKRHSRRDLDVKPEWYPLFLDSLVDTVRTFDPEFSPDVEAAWRAATARGVAYMQDKY